MICWKDGAGDDTVAQHSRHVRIGRLGSGSPAAMHRHRTPPALVAGLLLAVLAASVAGGWFIASSASGDRPTAAAQPDPAEPPYDAGDPTDGPPGDLAPAPAPPPQASP